MIIIDKIQTFQESVSYISGKCDQSQWVDSFFSSGRVKLLQSPGVWLEKVDCGLEDLIDIEYPEKKGSPEGTVKAWMRLRNQAQCGLIADRVARSIISTPNPPHHVFSIDLDNYKETSRECDNLLIDKQRDYGSQNILKFGVVGCVVRASDKKERLLNLAQKGKTAQNERVEDTWMDLRNYAQIVLMLKEDLFGLPLEEDGNVLS